MTLLLLGLALWIAAHLFKRVFPGLRARMGPMGRLPVAVVIVAGVVLMVIGYREADGDVLYALPLWAWYLNNLLMYPAIVLMDIGRVRGVIRTKLRHPMLTGIVVWSAAHLLVNGDTASLLLFGGLAAWALLEMAVINRAEGPWTPPERGRWSGDAKVLVLGLVLYALIIGVHYWLGYPVFFLA